MFGIISYRDLEYWDQIHPPKVRQVSQNYNSQSRFGFSFLVAGSPTQSNCYSVEEDNRGWYIMLLGNLNYETPALKAVLDNYEYLNRRTRDVRFFMPGFIVDRNGIVAFSQALDHREQFEFNDHGFLETIDWLEEGNQDYHYSENLEMVLLPYEKNGQHTSYDFQHMLNYNLDGIHTEGKNIIEFITRAVRVVQGRMTYSETMIQMDGVTSYIRSKGIYKVFIAGSKSLDRERDCVRAAFSQLTNRRDSILFQTWTFEDFERSFTPGGRQQDYNSFIKNEADTVIFILHDEVGGITLDEFNIALDSFKQTGHPQIHVYNQKNDVESINPDIQKIRDEINNFGQYYTDYDGPHDLKNQILHDFYEK